VRIGRTAVVTDTGRRRLGNEDAFIREPPLFAIADGMGGARAGEVAAGLAAGVLEGAAAETRGAGGLTELIAEANRRIWERSLADPETEGMGTTVTVALVDEPSGTVLIGHVGDSRAYRWREADLEQLTTDHSLVAELVESGILTPEEAERHPQRSAITRALGTEPAVEVDTFSVEAAPGDLFLLCSDGLSDMLADDEVAEIIAASDGDPARSAEALVAAANERGGEDNVTVILFELVADDVPVAADPEALAPSTETERTNAGAEAPEGKVRRHGAGPGGRLTALLVIAAVLGIAALVLYWGISK
jgi:serine/threonine protein phosphatase PrpC